MNLFSPSHPGRQSRRGKADKLSVFCLHCSKCSFGASVSSVVDQVTVVILQDSEKQWALWAWCPEWSPKKS